MDAIKVNNLSYKYFHSGSLVINNINLKIAKGEIVAISGLSGCGKSTLCLCLGGIIPHYLGGEMKGQVVVNGKSTRDYSVAQLAQEVGMVFQDPDTQLFSSTVEDELAFAPENLCLPVDEIKKRVNNVLDILGINALREENPSHLSGGQKHLVAMGAVLTLDPGILILDEVMAQLDSSERKNVAEILACLKKRGKTILLVEHDLENVKVADRVLVLEDGLLIRGGQVSEVLEDSNFLTHHKFKYLD